MKAIIILASRSRYHIPKIGGFLHAPEFGPFTDGFRPFVYQGRAFGEDEIAEANDAARRTLDTPIPNLGYSVTVRLISDADFEAIGKPVEPETPEWVEPQADAGYVVAVDPSTEEPAAEAPAEAAFRLDGKHIFRGDVRIGGLFGEQKQLRVVAEYTALRPEIEAWLATQTPADQ